MTLRHPPIDLPATSKSRDPHLAMLHAAHQYAQSEQYQRGFFLLRALPLESLLLEQRVYALFLEGFLELKDDYPEVALERFERARFEAGSRFGGFNNKALEPSLALCSLETGHHRRAYATLSASGNIAMLARSLTLLGRPLEALALVEATGGSTPELAVEQARALLLLNQFPQALLSLPGRCDLELELTRVDLLIALGELKTAQAALRVLGAEPGMNWTFQHRLVVLEARLDWLMYKSLQPLRRETLERAGTWFQARGYTRDAAGVALLQLEVGYGGNEVESLRDRARQRCALPSGSGWLAFERLTLPAAVAALDNVSIPRHLELRMMRGPGLYLSGVRLRTRNSRTLDLLYYLTEHPRSTLEVLGDAIRPDLDTHAGKKHVRRLILEAEFLVPGLRIEQRETQCYSLEFSGVLKRDIDAFCTSYPQDPLGALEQYGTQLLLCSDPAWLETERRKLMEFIVNVGLSCFRNWIREGDYVQCRKLSLRLLDLEPYDRELNLMLVQATEQLEGHEAAQRVIRARMAVYLEADLEPPTELFFPLEAQRQQCQETKAIEALLGAGHILEAIDFYANLPPALGEDALLDRRSLTRTLSVRAMQFIRDAFEASDFERTVLLAEKMLASDPFSPQVIEVLLGALLEQHGQAVTHQRVSELRAAYQAAHQPIPRVLQQHMTPDARVSVRAD